MGNSPETLTDEQIRERLEAEAGGTAGNPETPPAPAEPEGVEYKTETGQVYKGKDWEEVAQKIASAQEHASRTIREQKDERDALMAELQRRQNEKVEVPAPKKSDFDKIKYYETWQNDPLAAEAEAIKQVLAQLFEVDSFDELRKGYEFSYQKSLGLQQNEELWKFHAAHPEFSGSAEDATAITEWVQENNPEYDPSKGKFLTARDLEYAYYKLIDEGKIRPAEEPPPDQQREQAPPSLTGSAGQGGKNPLENPERLSDEELEKLARKMGVLNY